MSDFKIKKINSKKDIINFVKRDLWDNTILLKNKIKSVRLFKKLYKKRKFYYNLKYKLNYIYFKRKDLFSKYYIINKRLILKQKIIKYYFNLYLKLERLYYKKLITKIDLLVKNIPNSKKFNPLLTKLIKYKSKLILPKFKNLTTLKLNLNKILKYKSIKIYTLLSNLYYNFKSLLNSKSFRNLKISQTTNKIKQNLAKKLYYLSKKRAKRNLPKYFDYVQKKYITVKQYMTFNNLKLNKYNNDFFFNYFSKVIHSKYKKNNNFYYNNANKANKFYTINRNSLLSVTKIFKYKKKKIINNFYKAIIQKQIFKKYFNNISTKKLKKFYIKINSFNKFKSINSNNSFLYNLEFTIFFLFYVQN